MKIKDYKCKCGHDDFFFAEKGNNMGIYCSYCGKWAKWADKDERNLTMKPERKGKWIRISIDKYTQHAQAWYRCSVCGAEFIGEFNYCGHCGASMRGDNHV